jgi:F-type H+-transporting ATPase subunit alpha
MKKVSGPLRITLAQYRELEAFSQFGSELDEETQRQLRMGERLTEVLKQPQYAPLNMEDQVIMLYLANRGYLLDLDKEDVRDFLLDFIRFLQDSHPALIAELSEKQIFTDTTAATLDAAAEDFKKNWKQEALDYGTDI